MVKRWNEPCKIIEVLEVVSKCIGMDREELAE